MNSIPRCNDITGILSNTISYDHVPSLGFPRDTNMKRFYIPCINFYYCSTHEAAMKEFDFTLVFTLYIRTFYISIRMRLSILSVVKYYQKQLSCKTNAFHCLYVSSVPVQHKSSVANQMQACDMHYSYVTCVHWQSRTQ